METILIIDDSPFNIKYLTQLLEEDYTVISANNGRTGLEIASSKEPSLILLDIEMPGIDGFQVIEKLQKSKVTQQIPVVFLTGINDTKTEEKAFFNGAVDYIRKPFSDNVVCARVRTHISLFRYRKILEDQMNIDVLTELYTRKHCMEYLKEQWEKCIDEKIDFSLGIADIDFFKSVNDNYGHLEGDRVLKAVARIIDDTLKLQNGYTARMGGEEFLSILTGNGRSDTERIMKNICTAVSEKNIFKGGDPEKERIAVTISIGGITLVPSENDDLDEIMKYADDMMYKAKGGGRNRVEWR